MRLLECSLRCWAVEEILSGVPLGLMRTVLNQTSFKNVDVLRNLLTEQAGLEQECDLGSRMKSILKSFFFLSVVMLPCWFDLRVFFKNKI